MMGETEAIVPRSSPRSVDGEATGRLTEEQGREAEVRAR
jgi:hypothetical protein